MRDLGLDLDFLNGAPISGPEVRLEREMTLADVEALSQPKNVHAPTLVRRPSERHHALARALAAGMKEGEAGLLVGYDPSRVSILLQSPAFQELVALYRNEVKAEFAQFEERLLGLGKDAINELQTRLEDEPEKFTIGQLLEITTRLGDRAGYAPVQRTETTVNISLSEKMRLARERVEARARPQQIIDITPEDEK